MSPTASSRPATTGLGEPGSQTHTYASVGCSEVILESVPGDTHALREQRGPSAGAIEVEGEPWPILVEQRHADERCHLECDAEAHRRIAPLDLAHRGQRDPGSLSQIPHRPTPLASGEGDLGAEELRRFERGPRVCTS